MKIATHISSKDLIAFIACSTAKKIVYQTTEIDIFELIQLLKLTPDYFWDLSIDIESNILIIE